MQLFLSEAKWIIGFQRSEIAFLNKKAERTCNVGGAYVFLKRKYTWTE